jgi:hypothetical protein
VKNNQTENGASAQKETESKAEAKVEQKPVSTKK